MKWLSSNHVVQERLAYASRIQLLDISSDKPPLKYFTNLLRIKQPSTLSITLFMLSASNFHLLQLDGFSYTHSYYDLKNDKY